MASILVVDDDLVLNQLLSEILMYEGFEVVSAQSGAAALDVLRNGLPDAVVLDMELRDMPGRSVLRWMRGATPEGTPDIPVVAVTSGNLRASQDEPGIARVLGRPFHIPQMVRTLHELIGAGGADIAAEAVPPQEIAEAARPRWSGNLQPASGQ